MNSSKKDTTQKVQEFLHDHPMAILSTVSTDNKPWGSAIYCVADDDLKFYFVTREQTLKYKNLAHNPHAALTFADSERQRTVQVAGTISLVPAKDVIDVVFKKLARIKPRNDINWLPPVIKVHQGDWMVLCLTPTNLQYADFKEHKTKVSDEYITRLI